MTMFRVYAGLFGHGIHDPGMVWIICSLSKTTLPGPTEGGKLVYCTEM